MHGWRLWVSSWPRFSGRRGIRFRKPEPRTGEGEQLDPMASTNQPAKRSPKMVGGCRRLLTEDIRAQLQAVYGLQPDGSAWPWTRWGIWMRVVARLPASCASGSSTWRQPRSALTLKRNATAFDRMAGETAFTVLNRLAALRMCEERGHVVECVRRGMSRDGFQLYERLLNGALGTRPATYRFLPGAHVRGASR